MILTNKISLQTAAIFGQYRYDQTIPILFGNITTKPIQIDSRGYEFVISQSLVDVIEVRRDDQATNAYEVFTEIVDDVLYTLIRLRTPIATSEKIEADCVGIRSFRDGGVARNPALIIDEVLNIAGIEADLADFKYECNNFDIQLSGSINNKDATYRSIINEICNNSGAVFSDYMTGFARIYPRGGVEHNQPITSLDKTQIVDLSINCDFGHIATDAIFRYGFDPSGEPTGSVTLSASNLPYPETIKTFDLKWVSDQSVAVAIGKRLLSYYSRTKYSADFKVSRQIDIEIGDYISLTHNYVPGENKTVECFVVGVSESRDDTDLSVEFFTDEIPNISVSSISVRLSPEQIEPLVIDFEEGVLTITFLDSDGNPIVGAKATLDGDITKITNAQGQAIFTDVQTGSHSITATANNFVAATFEFTL